MFLVKSLLGAQGSRTGAGSARERTGGVVSGRSEAAMRYTPQPRPGYTHYSHFPEIEEIQTFKTQFEALAGNKMEVSPSELMEILNRALSPYSDHRTGRLGIYTCQSALAVMDSETNGKLGFEEFKHLWNNIKKWQVIYKAYASARTGTLGSPQLQRAFVAAGFHLSEGLYRLMVRRYSDHDGTFDFENFISCLVRLDAMFRAFKSLEKEDSGQLSLNLEEWLQLTMYS